MYLYQLTESKIINKMWQSVVKNLLLCVAIFGAIGIILSVCFLIYFLSWQQVISSEPFLFSVFILLCFFLFFCLITIPACYASGIIAYTNRMEFSREWGDYSEKKLLNDVRSDINHDKKEMGNLASEFFKKLLLVSSEREARKLLKMSDDIYNFVPLQLNCNKLKKRILFFELSLLVLGAVLVCATVYFGLCLIYVVDASGFTDFMLHSDQAWVRLVSFIVAVVYILIWSAILFFEGDSEYITKVIKKYELSSLLKRVSHEIKRTHEATYSKGNVPDLESPKMALVRKVLIQHATKEDLLSEEIVSKLERSLDEKSKD